MATYEEKMAGVRGMSADDLKALEGEIVKAFTDADNGDDLDAMSAAAVALSTVREALVASVSGSDVPEAGPADKVGEQVEDVNADEAEAESDEVAVDDESEVTASGKPNPFKKKAKDGDDDEPDDDEDDSADDKDLPDFLKKKGIKASAASDNNDQAKEATVDIPEDRAPVTTSPVTVITAGADIPGKSAGTPFTSAHEVSEAFVKRIDALRSSRGEGEQAIVASIATTAPDERTLDPGDMDGNAEKIAKVTDMDTIVASGGYCAPLEVRYDMFGLGVADRPVKAALAGFQARRGGIRYISPPKLGDLAAGVGLWTPATDAAPTSSVTNKALTGNVATLTTAAPHGYTVGQTVTVAIGDPVFDGTYLITVVGSSTTFSYNRTNANVTSVATSGGTASATKPCFKVTCQPEQTATLDAVTLCLTFGNLQARAFPELVTRHNELGMIQHARLADMTLLAKISALSTAVTSGRVLGFARDFLEAVGRAAAGYRHRHRMTDESFLRVMAPAWVRDAIREDLTRGLPGDKLEWADNVINGFFRTRRVNVSWHLDDASVLANAQGVGALNAWPSTFKWNLFAEGTFLFLDGGTLDLGIVRDSGLIATNDYKMFLETFEGVAKLGIEAIEVTQTTAVVGATSAAVTIP